MFEDVRRAQFAKPCATGYLTSTGTRSPAAASTCRMPERRRVWGPRADRGTEPRRGTWHQVRKRLLASAMICLVWPMLTGNDARAASISITFTADGVPHVRAEDFYGLGLGFGHASATLDLCNLARVFVAARGERALAFGGEQSISNGPKSPPDGSIALDLTTRLALDTDVMAHQRAGLGASTRDLVAGYADGYNRYLEHTPPQMQPEPCRGADWVKPISPDDVLRRVAGSALAMHAFAEELVAAQPPDRLVAPAMHALYPSLRESSAEEGYAVAMGSEETSSGRGLLLGVARSSSEPANSILRAHLTIPGRYDVHGAAELGMPLATLGFNRSLAWTHAASTRSRAAIYELQLDPSDATRYIVDGNLHEMTQMPVTILVREPSGAVRSLQHTFWSTIWGPVIASPQLPWTHETAYALADPNLLNNRALDLYLALGTAPDVSVLERRLAGAIATSGVVTIAADAKGEVLLVDYSVSPDVDAAPNRPCARAKDSARTMLVDVLDGSRSACAPHYDPRSPQPGIIPAERMSHLVTRGAVGNSGSGFLPANAGSSPAAYSRTGGELEAKPGRSSSGAWQLTERFQSLCDEELAAEPDLRRARALLRGNEPPQAAGNRFELPGKAASYFQVVSFDADGPVVITSVSVPPSIQPRLPAGQVGVDALSTCARAAFTLEEIKQLEVQPEVHLTYSRVSDATGQ